MGKFKTIPFDLEKARAGAKVVTRDGRPCRIIFYEKKGYYPIVVLVEVDKSTEVVYCCTIEGLIYRKCNSGRDLLIIEEGGLV